MVLFRVTYGGRWTPDFHTVHCKHSQLLGDYRRQYQGEDWTVGEFYEAVDQACDWLVNEAQIQKGDPIAIAMRNRPEWLVAFVATVTIGAVAVPLNSWGKAQELIQGLEDSKAKLVFCDSDRLAFIRELNTELPAVVVNESDGPQDTSLSEIRQRPVPSEPLIADVDRQHEHFADIANKRSVIE